jgi:hypothetical protein
MLAVIRVMVAAITRMMLGSIPLNARGITHDAREYPVECSGVSRMMLGSISLNARGYHA